MRFVAIAAVIVAATTGTWALAQQQQENTTSAPPQDRAQVKPDHNLPLLSPTAMEALVSGIAFYPDAVIELVLDASQYPDAILEAVAGTAPAERQQDWPDSVTSLASSPEILQQLKENAAITARLALAAQTQLVDLWSAIDRVRSRFESTQADAPSEGAAKSATVSSGALYPTGAFVAGYWTAQALDEIGVWYTTTAPIVYGQGAAMVTGPNGNSAVVSGSGGGAAVTVGDTTYFGAAGQGTVTTSNGKVISGEGQVTGSATQQGSGGSYQTHASGSISSNTGKYAQGDHAASGSAQTNPDGSVSFGRDGETNVSSSAGATSAQHAGSGTYTGQGTGNYSGSTNIESTHGDASVNTTAADGQITSTITTAQGEQTMTLGDGQAGEGSSTASQRNEASSTSRMARPQSVPSTNSRFAQANASQWQAANRALADSWGRLSAGTKNLAGMNAAPKHRAGVPPHSTPQFARPKSGTLVPQNSFNAPWPTGLQAPSRTLNSGPSRKPTGGGGRRRSRR
ncbi:MAG: DUF3300 domain-containing protein [Pirellulaceae bacterium]